MIQRTTAPLMNHIKKYSFLLMFVAMGLPWIGYGLAHLIGHDNLMAWFTMGVVYGLIPLADWLIGKDPVNPDETDVPALASQTFYKLVTLAVVPMGLFGIVAGAAVLHSWTALTLIGKLGWICSIGTVGGAIGITVAHELVHKDAVLETGAGGLLLAMVCYAGFKVEHVRGHHVHVSTPLDASSSRYNQSLYAFLPHAFMHNFLNAWTLEAKRLEHKGHKPLSWHNELIWWYGISLLLALAFGIAWGWMGLVFFLGQSLVASGLLEVVNYIEHYGLHRRLLANGRYERVQPEHSWNANDLLTNLLLLQLQRHSDHHANPKRRYQVLRHFEQSPQLPAGYATMILLALLPPLWFAVMNPRVEAYYAGEEEQLAQG